MDRATSTGTDLPIHFLFLVISVSHLGSHFPHLPCLGSDSYYDRYCYYFFFTLGLFNPILQRLRFFIMILGCLLGAVGGLNEWVGVVGWDHYWPNPLGEHTRFISLWYWNVSSWSGHCEATVDWNAFLQVHNPILVHLLVSYLRNAE